MTENAFIREKKRKKIWSIVFWKSVNSRDSIYYIYFNQNRQNILKQFGAMSQELFWKKGAEQIHVLKFEKLHNLQLNF